jgi:hypothetical protein
MVRAELREDFSPCVNSTQAGWIRVSRAGGDTLDIAAMLQAGGISARACADFEQCLTELADGAGALLMTEEVLEVPGSLDLLGALNGQPPWGLLFRVHDDNLRTS